MKIAELFEGSARNCGCVLRSIVWVLLVGGAARAQVTYTITDVGQLGSWGSTGRGINNASQVVGGSSIQGTQSDHAYRWTPGMGMIGLGTLGGTESRALGINSTGDVVGWAAPPGGGFPQRRAFLWVQGAGMTNLGALGSTSEAYRVNTNRQVIGSSADQPFYWQPGSAMVNANTLLPGGSGWSISEVADISDSGLIVGTGTNAGGQARAFLLSPGVSIVDLGTLGGTWSSASAINSSGAVVGNSSLANSQQRIFRWTSGAGMVALDTLGGSTAYAADISDSGDIAGRAAIADESLHWFLRRSGTTVDISQLLAGSGWVIDNFSGVSNAGLVGTATPPQGGYKHGFVLSIQLPVPDCNGNGIFDSTDIANGTSQDCNSNGVPDECDIVSGASLDCDVNGLPDECESPSPVPMVLLQPTPQTHCAGAVASFSVSISGAQPLAYQWQVSSDGGQVFSNISGAIGPSYSFTAQSAQNGNHYRCVVTNICGSAISTAATLTVNSPPLITIQPVSQLILLGTEVAFAVGVASSPSPTYQWQVSTDDGVTFVDIAGASASSFSFTAQLAESGNRFRCVVSNACGSVNSDMVTLTVLEPTCAPRYLLVATDSGWQPGLTYRYNFDGNGPLGQLPPIGGVDSPMDCKTSPWGELFISGSDAIFRFKIDACGNYVPNGAIAICNPHGLAFSPTGELFVCNLQDQSGVVHRFVFDPAGIALPNGEFQAANEWLNGLAFSPSGELFVSAWDGRVYRFLFTTSGDPIPNGFIPAPAQPSAAAYFLAFSPWGELFVPFVNGHVYRYLFSPNALIPNGSFYVNGFPTGVAFSPAGELFVTASTSPCLCCGGGGGGLYRFLFSETGQPVQTGYICPDGLYGITILDLDTVPQSDCNANGQSDCCDIANGGSQDSNANGVPDECDIPLVINTANPPAANPYSLGTQPFRDVLQTGAGGQLTQGIGGSGTPAEGPVGYGSIAVTFNQAILLTAGDVAVACSYTGTPAGATPCPTLTAVTAGGVGEYQITLSGPIPPGGCATITFGNAAPGLSIRYESLPGDVSMDGSSNTLDLLILAQGLFNGSANLSANLARYDIDRSGIVNTIDLLRLVQLLNGVLTTQAWNGATFAACP